MLALCASLFGTGAPAEAQAARRELVGLVRDGNRAPIEGATVEIAGANTRTDAKGSFRLWTTDIDTLTIAIHRLGFVGIEALLTARNRQWDTLVVELDPSSTRLPASRVSEERTRLGLRDFAERRAKGMGQFIDRQEIAAHSTTRLSDVLRGKRGIQLVKIPPGNNRYGVRFPLYGGGARGSGCIPTMWLDGMVAREMEIDDLASNTVEAIELYESFASVPSEFAPSVARGPPCGTIVVWTRVPDKRTP